MEKRRPKLKARRTKTQTRHTHATAAALEDALAVAWDIIHDQARSLAYSESRAKRIIEILKEARQGPHAYDPDRPSGQRVIIKKR